VEYEKLSEGVEEKVLLEFETTGDDDIFTQLLKLSEDTIREPEHEESEVFVVTDDVSIVSENVIDILSTTETSDALSVGEIVKTVGGVLSSVVNPCDVVN
jgi:hypothetical protein